MSWSELFEYLSGITQPPRQVEAVQEGRKVSTTVKRVNPYSLARGLLDELSKYVFGHRYMKLTTIAALLSGTNLLIVSPPGEAKTYTIDVLAALTSAKYYRRLMTYDTTVFDIIGYPVTKEVEADVGGKVARVIDVEPDWRSGIRDANIALFDEVFKAPGPVAQLIYDVLALRKLSWRGSTITLNDLWAVYGLTNPAEIREKLGSGDPVFEPLYDRFPVRLWLERTPIDQFPHILDIVYQGSPGTINPVTTPDEVRAAREAVRKLLRSKYHIYKDYVMRVVRAAKDAGIDISPRKAVQALPILPGLDVVGATTVEKFMILAMSFSDSQDQVVKVTGYLGTDKLLATIKDVEDRLRGVEESIRKLNLGDAAEQLRELEKELGALPEEEREVFMREVRRLKERVRRLWREVQV